MSGSSSPSPGVGSMHKMLQTRGPDSLPYAQPLDALCHRRSHALPRHCCNRVHLNFSK